MSAIYTSTANSPYDAAKVSTKRRAPTGRVHVEDNLHRNQSRRNLSSAGWDLVRNYSFVQWMLSVHLRYVAAFEFQCETGVDKFDDYVEKLVKEHSEPESFDLSGRLSREDFVRTLEGCAVADGDVFALKHSSMRLQAIEGTACVDPGEKKAGERWLNGVRVNRILRPMEAAFAEYDADGTVSNTGTRRVGFRNLLHHGYFQRFAQVRGISPLASAVNSCLDTYKFSDLALAKMRVEQLVALAIMQDGTPEGWDGYNFDFGDGPAVMSLYGGDKAEFLQGNSPGTNSQEMMSAVMMLSMKALDIPFSFYNESFTNFFGSKAAWAHYDRACVHKRNKLIAFLNSWLRWRLSDDIATGRLILPAGVDPRSTFWEWVPVGMPWWDISRDLPGEVAAINAGQISPQRNAKKHGENYYRNIDQRAQAEQYAAERGVKVSFGTSKETELPAGDPLEDEINAN